MHAAPQISRFRSRPHLISTLLTSCWIPWYFDGSLYTKYAGPNGTSLYFDGGITNFMPVPPGTERAVRVSCFPSQQLRGVRGRVGICPDAFEAWPHDLGTMLGWAFEPASDQLLLELVDKGRRDARAWAAVQALSSASGGSEDGGQQEGEELVGVVGVVRSSS